MYLLNSQMEGDFLDNVRDACSEFMLQGCEAIKVSARTMDWNTDLHSTFVIVPQHHKVFSYIDGDHTIPFKKGMSWESDYGYVGINVYNLPLYFDGLNEVGLSASLLFLKDTKYPNPDPDENKNISMFHLLQFILGKCASVEEVKKHLKNMTVCKLTLPQLQGNHGVHLILHDKAGNSLVIEAEEGKIIQYENQDAAILSNSPFLHWHLANRSNYCNLTNQNVTKQAAWSSFGNGSGMLGLPGDSTPPSRFIRMSILSEYSPISRTINEEIQQAFHIINRVTLVNGEVNSSSNGIKQSDYTQWEVVRDHINRMYYYRTNQNQSIRAINLNRINFSGCIEYQPLPLTSGRLYEDTTSLFQEK